MVNNNAARHLLFVASILLCIFGYVGYRLNRAKSPRYDAPVNQFASHQPAPPAAAAVVPAPPAQASTRPAIAPPAAKALPPPQDDDDMGEWIPSARGEELALVPAPVKPLAPPPSPYRPPQDDFAATPHGGVITGLIPAPPGGAPGLRPDSGNLPPSGLPIPGMAGGNAAPAGATGVPVNSQSTAPSGNSLPAAAVISGLKPPSAGPTAYPPADAVSAIPSAGAPNLPAYGGASDSGFDDGFDDSGDLATSGLPPSAYDGNLPPGMPPAAPGSYPGGTSLPPPSGLPGMVNGASGLPDGIGPPASALPPRSVAAPSGPGAAALPIPGAAGPGFSSAAPAPMPESVMRPGSAVSPRPPASGPASGPGDFGGPGGSASLPSTRPQAAPASGITVPGIPPAAGPRGPAAPPLAARPYHDDYAYDDTYDDSAVSGSESLRVYVVLPGDTLSSIASRELGSISLADNIFLLNRDVIADPDHLLSGVKIRLPVRENGPASMPPTPAGPGVRTPPSAPTPAASGPQKHVVARGETLSSISQYYYGTSSGWRFLADNNKKAVPNPNQLAVGVELTIPPFEEMKR